MWVLSGENKIGLTEGNNTTIQNMIEKLNSDFNKKPLNSDSEPWYGVFIYSCLTEVGVPITSNGWRTPALNSFYSLNWIEGTVIENPVFGAIAVMKYGHVAMIVGFNYEYVWILGGNQPQNGSSNRDGVEVNISRQPRSLVSKYIIPNNYDAPLLSTYK